jgi:prepilin-type N-terminal cleavage/methylation domain-containing protein
MIKIKIKNKIDTNNNCNKRAYTLVELSIVILVISLLMAGVFSMATGSINNSKVALTNQKMKEIYKSMGTFLMINKRLPCPASLARSKIDDVDYGKEERDNANNNCGTSGIYTSSGSGLSNLIIGAVPIKSLNLGSEFAEDGYENKLSYVIDKRFTKNFIPPTSGTLDDSFGTVGAGIVLMSAKENQVSGTALLSDKVIFILISHGPNGYGAFNSASGVQFTDANNLDVDELENQIKSSTPNFDNNFIINSYKSDVFDDVLMYKTRNNFIQDFSSSNLISCPRLANSGTFPAINLYYGQFLYDSSACASRNSVIRIYKCGNISGDWTDVVSSCPSS